MQPSSEQRLASALCAVRPLPAAELDAHVTAVDELRLLTLLRRLRLLTLAGARLRAAGVRLGPVFEQTVDEAAERAAAIGRMQELVLLSLTMELAGAGIRSVPLKGSALALAVHGDPALRVSGDLDLLVASRDLAGAVEVARRMGWRALDPVGPPLPLLHVRLLHPKLPPLELHWRVHWYEDRFAADALARAGAPAAGQSLRMRAADELAALLLFHARDGLSGLRLPADVSAWATSGRLTVTTSGELADLAGEYPALTAALTAAVSQLRMLVGVPVSAPATPGVRERAAVRLANPFLEGARAQVRADASFVDILLSPPGGVASAMRRQFDNAPRPERAPRPAPGTSTPPLGHIVRTIGRWGASAVRATVLPRPAVGAARPGRVPAGAVAGERDRAPVH